MLKDIFKTTKSVAASFYLKTTTDDGYGNVVEGFSSTVYTINKAFMFEGSQAERMVSESIRTEVYAVILINYFATYATYIQEKTKVTINGKDYSVISVEDVGHQNEVLQIPVKEF